MFKAMTQIAECGRKEQYGVRERAHEKKEAAAYIIPYIRMPLKEVKKSCTLALISILRRVLQARAREKLRRVAARMENHDATAG